jgi:hypothetical protein
LTAILAPQDGGFEWDKHTAVGADGYPRPVWDLATGKIDHEVVQAMKGNNYDLRDFLERNWSSIGSKLEGKLHVICGDEDGGYANLAVYLLEDFLEATKNPYYAGSFQYGRPLNFNAMLNPRRIGETDPPSRNRSSGDIRLYSLMMFRFLEADFTGAKGHSV